jgi:hypothetical protein
MDALEFKALEEEMKQKGISANTEKSAEWFLEKVEDMARNTPLDRRAVRNSFPFAKRKIVGQMFMFFYYPKTAQQLPYYDRFPLIFLLEHTKNHFMGLNLHYLPLDLRQQLYYRLLPRATTSEFTEYTRLKIDYNFLKSRNSLRAFKACIRRYRYDQMIGRMAHVPANEWELTVHLPLALWRKSSEEAIHQDSRVIARRIS